MKVKTMIKISLAVFLLLCLLDMPYGFYQLVRYLALIGCGILAYRSYEKKNNTLVITYIALAILFQPLLKISLGREIWNVIDVVVGAGLVVSLFVKNK